MQNEDGVENTLGKKNYSFTFFFFPEEFLCFEGCVVEVDVVDLKVSNYLCGQVVY